MLKDLQSNLIWGRAELPFEADIKPETACCCLGATVWGGEGRFGFPALARWPLARAGAPPTAGALTHLRRSHWEHRLPAEEQQGLVFKGKREGSFQLGTHISSVLYTSSCLTFCTLPASSTLMKKISNFKIRLQAFCQMNYGDPLAFSSWLNKKKKKIKALKNSSGFHFWLYCWSPRSTIR